MEHIISGHTTGGGRGDDNKDKWPDGVTEAAIAKAIQEAYNRTVQFWFDYTMNQIDSAWPK